jgi:hypothetical protein
MKLLYNIFKILAVVVIVFAITLFSASFLLQNKVAGVVIKSFNEKISTKFDIGSVRLSFLRKFPKAYLDLKNVLVHSSPGFDSESFHGINTDTLLSARSVSVEFKLTDIIKGIYNIERIGVKQGFLNLLSDTAGQVNYNITVENTQDNEDDFSINLDRVNLQELNVSYNNLATKLSLKGFIKNSRLKSRITDKLIDFNTDGELRIDLFMLYNFTVTKSISTFYDIALHSSDSGILFDKSIVSFDGYNFGLSGSVSPENILDLTLYGDNIDISGIRNYLPENYGKRISEYNPGGTLRIESRLTGLVSSTVNPGIEVFCTVENGSVSYINSPLTIKDLSFKCLFNNGSGHSPGTSMLIISDLSGNLGSANYSGSLTLSDFDSLKADILLRGRIIPAEVKEFFDLKEITWSEGNINMDLKMHGYIPNQKKYSIRDFLNLNPAADLHFNSFGIGLKKGDLIIRQVGGELFVDKTVIARNLVLSFRGHSFSLNGRFNNLPGWLMGDPVVLTGTAEASCEKLIPEALFPSSFSGDTATAEKSAVSFPGDIILDLGFKIDTLKYKNFTAHNVNGTVSYKPRIFNFKTLTLNSLDGIVSGNGFIVQNTDKSFVGRGAFSLEGINIRNTFSSFNNFGQDFLKAENIDGKLSGSLSLLMPMDSLLKPNIKLLSAEGKYLLTDGSLVNFDPVKSLSSFIELSDLENIHFEELENDFFIKSNILYIPQMDIRSSAADLSVNGKHNFDNEYEYHFKILLSELLSKKLKKPKPNTAEFGAVRDDGLGRTSLLLKIESKGDDVKVGYDVKAAGDQIKSNIKAERKNLKTILNEEYGWFKNDTVIEKKTASGTPRFKISWEEEADTLKEETTLPAVKKDNVIRNIFKKK